MIIELFGTYRNVNCDGRYLEWYRSGHNEHDWKSCGRVERPEGSNPSHSAMKGHQNRCLRKKAQKFQLFHPIGTQCVIGVQLVRAKARRKLMHLSLRLVFTWNRIYKGNISFVKGLKQLNNS